MKIMPMQNNNKPVNFRSVNRIMVLKTAFPNTDSPIDVFKKFNKAVNKTTGEVNDFVGMIFNLLGLGSITNKTFTYFEESPQYHYIIQELKECGASSIFWLRQHTRIPIAEPLSPNYYSFTVLTKEQKDKASVLYSMKNIWAGWKTMNSDEENKAEKIWQLAKANQLLTEQLSPIVEGQPIHEFRLKNLSELPEAFKQIEY